MQTEKKVVLALGANLGDRRANLVAAEGHIAKIAKILARSEIYETEPEGYADQPNFYNAALLCKTSLSPQKLLEFCKSVEAAFGREKPFPNAPRPIDIDIIFYEGVSMKTDNLEIPHPRWSSREFVLAPLRDIIGAAAGADFAREAQSVLARASIKYKPIKL